VEEVDDLTFPQAMALIERIKKEPPTNILISELLKALGAKKDGDTGDLDRQLSKFPNVEKKTTKGKTLKMVNKRTGKRIL